MKSKTGSYKNILFTILILTLAAQKLRSQRDNRRRDIFPRPPIEPPSPGRQITTLAEYFRKNIYSVSKSKRLDFSAAPAGYALTTDKPVYKPGEKIRGQVYFYDKFTKAPLEQAPKKNEMKVTLKDARGQKVQSTKVFKQNDYAVYFVHELDNEQPGGFYQLEFERQNVHLVQRQTVYVMSYDSPQAVLTLETNLDLISGGEQVICEATLNLLGRQARANELEDLTVQMQVQNEQGNRLKLDRAQAKTDDAGKALLRFRLPRKLGNSQSFTVSVRVEFENRVYRASKQLLVASLDQVVIEFTPAGGKWVENVKNSVFFRAFADESKRAEFVFDRAEIIRKKTSKDKSGKTKTAEVQFDTQDRGMGRFSIVPSRKYKHYLRLTRNGDKRSFLIVDGGDYRGNTFGRVAMLLNRRVMEADGTLKVHVRKPKNVKLSSMWLVVQDKTRVLLEKRLRLRSKLTRREVWLGQLDFAQGGVLTVQIFRPGQFGSPEQESLVYVHPRSTLQLDVDFNRTVYTPGDTVKLRVEQDAAGNDTLLGVAVSDESSFLQVESKRLPPSLPTKVFLENELYFESGEFPGAGQYLDWYFDSRRQSDRKQRQRTGQRLLKLMLANQKWRLFFLAGDYLRRIINYNDAFGKERKGSLEYLLARRLSQLRSNIRFRRNIALAAEVADDGDMMEDESAEDTNPESDESGTEPPENEEQELQELVKQDTVYYSPLGRSVGKSNFKFKLPSRIGKFRVTVVGVSKDGHYGMRTEYIQAQRPFNLRVDYPLYVRKRDKLILDVVIENNTARAKRVRVSALSNIRTVRPRSSISQKLEVSFDELPLEVSAQDLGSKKTVSVEISPKKMDGFLFHEAGTVIVKEEDGQVLSNRVRVKLPENVIDNRVTFRVQYKPFSPRVILSGLKRLVREPYGCFEQTSATTFPMVMLLQYLSEQKASDAIDELKLDIEQKLRRGVKKLLSFETPTGGFEWFGQSPGHATLTAYGIWQFVELNKLGQFVPPEVIDRTLNWLRGQFDGDEGHFIFGRGLDSFARPPLLVSDVYILFVMTLLDRYAVDYSSVLNPWLFRYQTDALKKNDSYLLSFVGLALLNQGLRDEARKIARQLVKNQDASSGEFLKAETSITRSHGQSLSIETTAIAVIFLQTLDFATFLDSINRGVDFLQRAMQDGYFGSTQPTVLALKALTENLKLAKKSRQVDRDFRVSVGGKSKPLSLRKGKRSKPVVLKADADKASRVKVATSDKLRTGEKHVFSVEYKFRARSFSDVAESPLKLQAKRSSRGDTQQFSIQVRNRQEQEQGMLLVVLHKPSFTKINLNDLETLRKKGKIAFYETRNSGSEIMFYWRGMAASGSVNLTQPLVKQFDHKGADPVAVTAYLYYDKEGSFIHKMLK